MSERSKNRGMVTRLILARHWIACWRRYAGIFGSDWAESATQNWRAFWRREGQGSPRDFRDDTLQRSDAR